MRAARPALFVRISLLAASLLAASGGARAATVPFAEDFPSDASGWKNGSVLDVSWAPSGGPDDGSHIEATMNYFGFESPFGGGPVVFRVQDEFEASGGAFEGDWLADGIGEVRAFVRQDTGEDLNFFLRVATRFNIPGAVFEDDVTVPSGVWTQVSWTIDPASPLCSGEGVTCAEALADVGHLQIGTDAPEALVVLDQGFALALDQVELRAVPEPAAGVLAATGALVLAGTSAAGRARPQSTRR